MARKKKINNYFDSETKKSFVKLIKSNSLTEMNRIYEKDLYKPLDEMIKINIHAHGFYHTGFEIDSLIQELHLFLVSKFRSFEYDEIDGFSKFDPEVGNAFSYCNRMIKNFLIQLQQKNQAKQKKLGFDSIDDDENFYIETFFEEEKNFEISEFFEEYITYMENHLELVFDLEDDYRIAYILLELLKDKRNNFANKKTLLSYMKSIISEKSYKINKVINTFRSLYFVLKKKYYEKLELEQEKIENEE